MMVRKYAVWTLGCKVNQYESQQLRELLASAGFVEAEDGQPADLIVVNTCAVTATAARKSRQLIRRAVASTPGQVVVVGCCATAEADRIRRIPGVSCVMEHRTALAAEFRRFLARSEKVSPLQGCAPPEAVSTVAVGRLRMNRNDQSSCAPVAQPVAHFPTATQHPPGGAASYYHTIPATEADVKARRSPFADGLPPIRRFAGHQRAFVKVQDGCDAACTYCIIPRLRPGVRWKPIRLVVEEVRGLVEQGHREIVLTGIFLGAYGRTTAWRSRWRSEPSALARLIEAVAEVPGLERLRLSSIEPGDVSDELIEAIRRHPNCAAHVHLPLQSGSDAILKRMNRQYRVEDFLRAVHRLKDRLDRPAITTDILVGFPGETEADFAATLQVAREAGFSKIHAFPFSPRPDTPAAAWKDRFVPRRVVAERMQRLRELEAELAQAFRRQFLGHVERVLVESAEIDTDPSEPGPEKRPMASDDRALSPGCSRPIRQIGRADRYFPVCFQADHDLTGRLVLVRIERVTTDAVLAIPLEM